VVSSFIVNELDDLYPVGPRLVADDVSLSADGLEEYFGTAADPSLSLEDIEALLPNRQTVSDGDFASVFDAAAVEPDPLPDTPDAPADEPDDSKEGDESIEVLVRDLARALAEIERALEAGQPADA
jgi:hypothetical protein